jgi:hypothetical protein
MTGRCDAFAEILAAQNEPFFELISWKMVAKLCVNSKRWAESNIRVKLAPTAWRWTAAQNGPQAQRLMASVPCRRRSA